MITKIEISSTNGNAPYWISKAWNAQGELVLDENADARPLLLIENGKATDILRPVSFIEDEQVTDILYGALESSEIEFPEFEPFRPVEGVHELRSTTWTH